MPTTPAHMEHQPQPGPVLVPSGQRKPEAGGDEYRDTMDAVGRLAGKVAHHLNSLITVIEGHAWLLEDELVDGPLPSELREIRDGCRRATDLSTQLLSISGRRWREPRVVDLRTLVSDLDLGRFFSGNSVFCTDFAAVTCPVRVDSEQLEEAVVGLVLRAKKAVGHSGTVLVRIDHLPGRWLDGSPGTARVQLEVSDSGRGVEKETPSKASHPSFRTDPLLEDRGRGMSVAYGIVRQSGGTMTVSSAPGYGTTVRVCLPAVAPAAVAPA